MRDIDERHTGLAGTREPWDHSSHAQFVSYYAKESLSAETLERFRRQRDLILSVPALRDRQGPFDIGDIGCGAGTLAHIWAELGHRVRGLDVNASLIELARQRAKEADGRVEFFLGSATNIPWEDDSLDVCFAPELLEHVSDWNSCLAEFGRILRPGGVLFLSTTNKLCPVQQEFNLPLYSWYPGFLKRRYERLAVTTRPQIANYAKYPAVNWFTFFSLRSALTARGFTKFYDRFDLAALRAEGPANIAVLGLIRSLAPLRLFAHVLTEGTKIAAIKAGH